MALRPLEDKVAVRPIEDPSISKGGIWVPDQAKQRIDQGVVIYRGPSTVEVRVGDHVFFSGYTGTKISVEDEGIFIVLREDDILFILEGDKTEVLFPLSDIERLIDEAYSDVVHATTAELLVRRAKAKAGEEGIWAYEKFVELIASQVRQVLLTKFREYIRAEGFEF